jgi:hypothetical protein
MAIYLSKFTKLNFRFIEINVIIFAALIYKIIIIIYDHFLKQK